MELIIEVFDALCHTSVFVINGVEAEENDFGDAYDAAPRLAEEYGCGNKVFESRLPTREVLQKYNITVEEYDEIAGELEHSLSFGHCGWCV